MIELRNVTKEYSKGNPAINGVSVKIERGEFVFIVGDSGSGKSTLIRLIMKELNPTEGTIIVNGQNLNRMRHRNIAKYRRGLGVVFQDFRLLKDRNIYENIAFALRVTETPTRIIKKKVPAALSLVGLAQKYKSFPKELSGGEQQRVALVRALATEPDFLLLDEPLSALDAKVRLTLRREICNIQRELNLTTIMVTHDQDEALTMADRIVVMNKAVIMQSGTPEQIYENPENPFVADFIGSINFISAEEGAPYGLVKGKTAAVRPEKIQISRTEQAGSLRGEIRDIEFRGFYNRVTVGLSHVVHGDITLAVDVPFQTAKTMRFRTGENVWLVIPQDEVLQFETA